MLLTKLDKGKTLSEKVYDLLLEEIRKMSPGENKLPSEEDLSARMGVSRSTVREAIKTLTMQSVVTKIQGKGVFAHPSVVGIAHRVDVLSDFNSMLKSHYEQVNLEIEHLGMVPPSELFLEHMPVCPESVFAMNWIYSAQGQPVIFGQYEFAAQYLKSIPPENFWVTGLPDFGRQYLPTPIAQCHMHINCGIHPGIGRFFGVAPDMPIQCWQEHIVDIEDRAVGFCNLFIHPTQIRLSIVTPFDLN